ncbi:hypothetical protein C0Q70_15427 [Pomacea canaliculata]|uniref:Uncharacterized protein n=1 Tax=Pomacea canaliculata TaxID=400727 RepID=A0A2T7NUU1_POMCA|nr:hypothetical protein C0Q70_15427 [Pomacea canaliculata]
MQRHPAAQKEQLVWILRDDTCCVSRGQTISENCGQESLPGTAMRSLSMQTKTLVLDSVDSGHQNNRKRQLLCWDDDPRRWNHLSRDSSSKDTWCAEMDTQGEGRSLEMEDDKAKMSIRVSLSCDVSNIETSRGTCLGPCLERGPAARGEPHPTGGCLHAELCSAATFAR